MREISGSPRWYRPVNRPRGTHVLAENADIRRDAATGHLDIGQQLDQLALPSGGVFGRHHHQIDGQITVLECSLQSVDGVGLVVLDADHHVAGAHQVGDHLDAADHLVGVFTQQHVIGGDVGLTLRGVDDQGVDDMVIPQVEFHIRGEAGTAMPAIPQLRMCSISALGGRAL